MNCFNYIINEITEGLSSSENLSDISFIKSYPLTQRPSPIDKVYVTIGFIGIDILKRTFSDYIEQLSSSKIYGREVNISLRVKIYSPKRRGGEGCIEAFERVCDWLIFGQKDYSIKSIENTKIDYDPNLTSMTLSSVLKMSAIVKNE